MPIRGGGARRESMPWTKSGVLFRRAYPCHRFHMGGGAHWRGRWQRRPPTPYFIRRFAPSGANGGAGSSPSLELWVLRWAPKGEAMTRRHHQAFIQVERIENTGEALMTVQGESVSEVGSKEIQPMPSLSACSTSRLMLANVGGDDDLDGF